MIIIDKPSDEELKISIWRDWWPVKHILSELPILDGICKCRQQHEMIFYSTRSAVTLLVGTAVMMANLFHLQASDPMLIKGLKMAAGMSVGMASGAIFHNIVILLRRRRR